MRDRSACVTIHSGQQSFSKTENSTSKYGSTEHSKSILKTGTSRLFLITVKKIVRGNVDFVIFVK